MRFNVNEITGSRVRLRYSVDLAYEVGGPAEFLLAIHAARTPRQTVLEEEFVLEPFTTATIDVEPLNGNRIAAFAVGPGSLSIRYSVLVELAPYLADPDGLLAETPSLLPKSALRFIYPSRYCQSDLIQQQAWDLFGALPRGYGQVLAVRDWVRSNVRFQIGTSFPATTAVDTLRTGVGVCRDFAHTMIALCRALNFPARYVTGVDFGADPSLGPPDFHAYVEVFIGGRWFVFDATGISPVTGLVRIGTGFDAADVSFATIFGNVRAGMPVVAFSAIDDPVQGFALPVPTELAISTAY